MIAEETFNQNNLLCSLFSFSTKSGKVSFIFSTGNCSPITPVEANIRSLIFTVSEVPFSDLESLKVKITDRKHIDLITYFLNDYCSRNSKILKSLNKLKGIPPTDNIKHLFKPSIFY